MARVRVRCWAFRIILFVIIQYIENSPHQRIFKPFSFFREKYATEKG